MVEIFPQRDVAFELSQEAILDVAVSSSHVKERFDRLLLRRWKLQNDLVRLQTQVQIAKLDSLDQKRQRLLDRINTAAKLLQAASRGRLGRKMFAKIARMHNDLNFAATRIQRQWRGHACRSQMRAGRKAQLQEKQRWAGAARKAAVIVQKCCRNFVARREVARRLHAVMTVQALSRGFLQRKLYERRKKHQAIVRTSELAGVLKAQELCGKQGLRPHPPPGGAINRPRGRPQGATESPKVNLMLMEKQMALAYKPTKRLHKPVPLPERAARHGPLRACFVRSRRDEAPATRAWNSSMMRRNACCVFATGSTYCVAHCRRVSSGYLVHECAAALPSLNVDRCSRFHMQEGRDAVSRPAQ
jgi:hypothetical protein